MVAFNSPASAVTWKLILLWVHFYGNHASFNRGGDLGGSQFSYQCPPELKLRQFQPELGWDEVPGEKEWNCSAKVQLCWHGESRDGTAILS